MLLTSATLAIILVHPNYNIRPATKIIIVTSAVAFSGGGASWFVSLLSTNAE
jgi:hypothetical protein